MATKKRKSSPRKPAVRRPRTAALPRSVGPVTLGEAQRLAAAKVPSMRRALVGRRGAAAPTPVEAAEAVTVGQARATLVRTQDEERRRREKEYAQIIRIMKQRGATDIAFAPGGRRSARAAKTIIQPLKVFAEGDSWFDYPPFLLSGGVIPRLQRLIKVPILNMARAGDEVRFMLGVKQRKSLIEKFTAGCPAGGPWDALLFSGGGNDITDNPMVLWVKDFIAGGNAKAHLDPARFATALSLVRIGYEDLITLRDQLSPKTALFFHGYDFAIPDGRGVCGLGPWLKPTFDIRRIVDPTLAFEIVKEMLFQFEAMLTTLAAKHANVHVVGTQGTLKPVSGSWHNELHPSKKGFDQIAARFHASIKGVFPDRVF
ncbi:MAG TPA: hypothetical protein PKE27_04580 [Povalibacter sp.]|uniref:hypothetical protein n=1 Tax=Povalibacter sp. TaxID=1962978 RepID=UPI002CF2CB90|nr:hypothetical protein [Povalibacter sp.]HMN43821.1 hypothetical protein [Povalibacter sp.]